MTATDESFTASMIFPIVTLMSKWQVPTENHGAVPLQEIERREVFRAIALSGGSITKAAQVLKISKGKIYRTLRNCGYTAQNRVLQAQASALAGKTMVTGSISDDRRFIALRPELIREGRKVSPSRETQDNHRKLCDSPHAALSSKL